MRTGFTRKRCPNCGGNVFLDRDSDGWYEQCLQCSRTWYLQLVVETEDEADAGVLAMSRAEQ